MCRTGDCGGQQVPAELPQLEQHRDAQQPGDDADTGLAKGWWKEGYGKVSEANTVAPSW